MHTNEYKCESKLARGVSVCEKNRGKKVAEMKLMSLVMVVAFFALCEGDVGGIWIPLVPAVPVHNYSNPAVGSSLSWGCRPHYYNTTGTHSVFLGCVGYNDKLFYSEAHVKSGKWFASREETIKYPAPGYVRNETITGVWIYDRYRNGQGGHARILSGGPGSRNITIQLYSTGWLRGFNFLVQIYGR